VLRLLDGLGIVRGVLYVLMDDLVLLRSLEFHGLDASNQVFESEVSIEV
jgi:hypothetical protein